MPMQIEFAVTTVPRPENYINRLIACFGGRPLRLVVGSRDVTYLACYAGNPDINVIQPTEEDWQKFKDRGVHHRAMWNYWRTLVYGSSDNEARGLTIFEDDVILAYGWFEHLQAAIQELEVRHQDMFALALYSACRFNPPVQDNAFTVPYPIWRFFGTQAVYYPNRVRVGFARFLKVEGVEHHRKPYDLLLKEYLGISGTYLSLVYPCLAQHIGIKGTGLGHFHQTSHFKEA
jgi:hypothetical protein